MAKRNKRGFVNAARAMEGLKTGRAAAIQVCIEAKIHSEEYKMATEVTKAIDNLAAQLCGDRETFWVKPHGTPHTIRRPE